MERAQLTIKATSVVSIFMLALLSVPLARVKANPGVSITVAAIDSTMSGSDRKARFRVTIEDENIVEEHVKLTVTGLPSGWSTTLSQGEFDMAPGTSVDSNLEITGSASAPPGDYSFTVKGKFWGFPFSPFSVEWASCAGYVHVVPTFVIPETPLGVLSALLPPLLALVMFGKFRKRMIRPA